MATITENWNMTYYDASPCISHYFYRVWVVRWLFWSWPFAIAFKSNAYTLSTYLLRLVIYLSSNSLLLALPSITWFTIKKLSDCKRKKGNVFRLTVSLYISCRRLLTILIESCQIWLDINSITKSNLKCNSLSLLHIIFFRAIYLTCIWG